MDTTNRTQKEILEYYQQNIEQTSFIFREMCRNYLSSRLMDTDEEHPLLVDIVIEPFEAFGMSSLEMPRIVSMFQQPGEGIIWLKEDGMEDSYREFDSYPVDELYQIIREFEINQNQ